MSEQADQDQDQDQGEAEAGRIESLDARFGRLEHEQAEQRSMLEQIRDAVGGAKAAEGKAHARAQEHTEQRLEHPPAQAIAEQVRRAVADVDAEREQKRREAEHDADHQHMRELAERPPREQLSGWRGRLQTAMFGRPE